MSSNDDDAWDVFGSEEEEDNDNEEGEVMMNAGENKEEDDLILINKWIQQLTQIWMLQNAGVRLSERVVGLLQLVNENDSSSTTTYYHHRNWKTVLETRGIQMEMVNTTIVNPLDQPLYDAIICFPMMEDKEDGNTYFNLFQKVVQMVVPGGIFVVPSILRTELINFKGKGDYEWIQSELNLSFHMDSNDFDNWALVQRRVCGIQWKTCRWLPSNYDIEAEFERLRYATVALSIHEHQQRKLTPQSLHRATKNLQQYGYCVITGGLLNPQQSDTYGKAVLSDLEKVAEILKTENDLQLFSSGAISEEAVTYREISQREHFRVDIRHGPTLEKLRGKAGNMPCTMTALTPGSDDFLRGNADILEIIRRVMNPVDDKLSPGNFGRYNFEGRGPDGSFQDIRVGPVGGIVTWPGATDQALHADTPHLFEHIAALPAHYINVFTPGSMVEGNDEHQVGQTAFLHETHKLDVTARYESSSLLSSRNQIETSSTTEMWRKHLVRPKLQIGDIVLFDCRILHFGLPNESQQGTFRPLLYTNVTMHWFHDPKNWDNEKRIFKL